MARYRKSLVENLQLMVFTIGFAFAGILVFWLIVSMLKNVPAYINILFALFWLILTVLVWAHLYILFNIPQSLAVEFDKIKNKLAAGEIDSNSTFQKLICDFLVRFYNYSLFDVTYAAVKLKASEPSFSDEKIENSFVWDNLEKQFPEKEAEQLKHGKIRVDGSPFYAYSTPVYFAKEYLGYFTVYSHGRLNKMNLRLLRDLENHYLDDQIKLFMALREANRIKK